MSVNQKGNDFVIYLFTKRQLGFIGATSRINVILNGAEDLSYVNVQIQEAGNEKYFLSINGLKIALVSLVSALIFMVVVLRLIASISLRKLNLWR